MTELKNRLSKLYLKVKKTPEITTFDEISKELWSIMEYVESISDISKEKDKKIDRLKAENCKLDFELQRLRLHTDSEKSRVITIQNPEYLKD